MPRLLRHPFAVGMRRAAGQVHATTGDFDEEQHVQPLEPDGQRVYGKPATLQTKVSFAAPGAYRLRAIASDGQAFSTYDVDITVK